MLYFLSFLSLFLRTKFGNFSNLFQKRAYNPQSEIKLNNRKHLKYTASAISYTHPISLIWYFFE